MAIEIIIPRLGWSMDEGTFGRWLKSDGDYVREGDELFELEGDKAVQHVESFDSGILRIAPNGPGPGDVVTVGQKLGYLCKQGEPSPYSAQLHAGSQAKEASAPLAAPPHDGNGAHEAPRDSPEIEGREATPGLPGRVATPSARRRARELGVNWKQLAAADAAGKLTSADVLATAEVGRDGTLAGALSVGMPAGVSPRAARAAARWGVNLAEVVGSGTSGRIRERDVLAALSRRESTVPPILAAGRTSPEARQPTPGTSASTLPTSLRQTIAVRMLAAAQQTAAVTLTASVDATSLVNLRQSYRAGTVDRSAHVPSYTDLLVKLSAAALERHPALLGQWSEQGIILPDGIHVAVAVDTPSGLLTPVLRDVPARTLLEVSEELAGLVSRARARRLTPDELRGGTFTVSNLGSYRVEAFSPLLNLPQSAILGVGRISRQPSVVEDRVEARDRMTLSLTFDHRVVDGATAAAMLTTLCELIESPVAALIG